MIGPAEDLITLLKKKERRHELMKILQNHKREKSDACRHFRVFEAAASGGKFPCIQVVRKPDLQLLRSLKRAKLLNFVQ